MPLAIYVLSLAIFCMTTSEFMVAGMMNTLAGEFGVSVSQVGYLITAFSAGMVVGGPLLTAALLNMPRKKAFIMLTGVFLAGQLLGAIAGSYEVMMASRIIAGVASSAAFGVSISISASLVEENQRGRAVSIIFGGLMIATVLGTPAATWVADAYGWRFSFWAVAILVLLSGVTALRLIPVLSRPEPTSLRHEMKSFRNRKLWAAYLTSFLIIGATFAAFSYFAPIFTELTGFSTSAVPLLFVVYGAATVVGNLITGRLADRYTMLILTIGLVLLTFGLLTFAIGVHTAAVVIPAVVIIGLVGVPMNPPMVARVIRAGGSGLMVNTVHTAIVTFGVVVGSSVGGLAISAGYGLVAPIWVGVVLALVGVISLLPYMRGIFKVKVADMDIKH
ncbi:MFS transporter [Paenibacillus marchantiae]|uniref:MFS transporter n=1 Tax=Paenibacillus TaxID=44249 RepID=UPI00088B771D|nr:MULTISPECIES: MFS transporter [Paenibacillus]MCZ1269355.1 MFS transporter [Paenibacillus tundrae]WDQ30662.1 MFS transporter [Paenibacillus marchantiae]SDK14242.1 Predicted arabinose efflux permease, MFS family [Paenibacillus sp. OK060]SEA47589.1 Predicted arabinose efflux permease, MFS family [Paenibacillus sp. 276b]